MSRTISKVTARKDSSSRYIGVIKRKNGYEAQIRIDGEYRYLGKFAKEDDAARAYNLAVEKYCSNKRTLNNLGEDNRSQEKKSHCLIPKEKIKYRGVYSSRKSFIVKIQFNKRQYTIGTFDSMEKAALAYNIVSKYLKGLIFNANQVQMTIELMEFADTWKLPDKILKLKEGLTNGTT